jgi:hypothetical protein
MIFALERLRALREGAALDTPHLPTIEELPIEWRADFEERAAILEYDGGLSREMADAQALREIIERLRRLKSGQGGQL